MPDSNNNQAISRSGAQSGVLTTDRSLDPLGGGESMGTQIGKGRILIERGEWNLSKKRLLRASTQA